ncbi:DUF5799 family protein [Halobacteriales archaeon Cl-PHB]
MSDWQDQLAGARMQVDQRFQDRVSASDFSNQEWGLIMTAVEFEVQFPEDPEGARLVANTDHLDDIVPELGRIQKQMGGSPTPVEDGPDRGGILGSLRSMLDSLSTNHDNTPDEAKLADARELTQGYADELQAYLEERGRWDEIRQAAAADQGQDGAE